MHGRNCVRSLQSIIKARYLLTDKAMRIFCAWRIELHSPSSSSARHSGPKPRRAPHSSRVTGVHLLSALKPHETGGLHSHSEPAGQSVLTRSIELEHGGAVYYVRSLACDSPHCLFVNTAPSVANIQNGSWNVALLGQCHPHPIGCKKPPAPSCAAHVSTIPSVGAYCPCDLPPDALPVVPPLTEVVKS